MENRPEFKKEKPICPNCKTNEYIHWTRTVKSGMDVEGRNNQYLATVAICKKCQKEVGR